MDIARKASLWIIDNPKEFVDSIVDLVVIGFDMDKNSAGDLIRCAYEYSHADLNLPERETK